MNRLVLLFLLNAFSGCAEKEWTEGFFIGGFKDTYRTTVVYDIGGPTTLSASLESDAADRLLYPINLQVYLNGSLCKEVSIKNINTDSQETVVCSSNLGPGTHEYVVKVSNPNNFINLTEEEDTMLNTISGSITYTLEENL